MDFSNITLFSAMQHKMEYLSQRQATLSQNVVNVDTPGYKPQDIEKPDFDAMVNPAMHKISLCTTSPMHQQSGNGGNNAYKIVTRESAYETNLNKNKVSLDEEMQQISSNAMDYQMVTSMYRKTVDMFRTAIGRNGG